MEEIKEACFFWNNIEGLNLYFSGKNLMGLKLVFWVWGPDRLNIDERNKCSKGM